MSSLGKLYQQLKSFNRLVTFKLSTQSHIQFILKSIDLSENKRRQMRMRNRNIVRKTYVSPRTCTEQEQEMHTLLTLSQQQVGDSHKHEEDMHLRSPDSFADVHFFWKSPNAMAPIFKDRAAFMFSNTELVVKKDFDQSAELTHAYKH